MSEYQGRIGNLRAEREALATGPSKLNAEARQRKIRELSAQIRALEGPAQAIARKGAATALSVRAS